KSALNAITQALAIELEGTNIKVRAVCPGLTATDMSEYGGPVEDAAREPVRVALLGPDSPTGTFSNAQGALPWWPSQRPPKLISATSPHRRMKARIQKCVGYCDVKPVR